MHRWFTSDQHWGHYNTIAFFGRPFRSLEGMHRQMIINWNNRVKPEDEVFVLGDWCIKKDDKAPANINTAKYWESKLNGKIIYIRGNHDNNNGCKAIIDEAYLHFGGRRVLLIHDPARIQNAGRCDLALTGHVHEKWKIRRIKRMFDFVDCINVGVDVWGFRPVSFNELMKRYHHWLKTKEGQTYDSPEENTI